MSGAREGEFLENSFDTAMGILHTVMHSQIEKLVYAKLFLFVTSVVMRFAHEGSLRTWGFLSLIQGS